MLCNPDTCKITCLFGCVTHRLDRRQDFFLKKVINQTSQLHEQLFTKQNDKRIGVKPSLYFLKTHSMIGRIFSHDFPLDFDPHQLYPK